MQPKAQKCWFAYLLTAEKKSMKWFAKQSPLVAQPTMNHKTTVLCTDMDFKI